MHPLFASGESLVGKGDAITRRGGEHRGEANPLIRCRGVGADRKGATDADRGKEGPFDVNSGRDEWIINCLQERGGITAGSGLNRDRALTGRWNQTLDGKGL